MILAKYIIEPENNGIVILSFTDTGIISITDAISAPNIKIYTFTGKLKHIPTNIDEIKPAKNPDNVLFPILIYGKLIPIIAANVSPTDKNNKAKIEKGYGIKIKVKRAPKNTQVAPVNLSFFSLSLNINPKKRKKIFEYLRLSLLTISIKKEKITNKERIQSIIIKSLIM